MKKIFFIILISITNLSYASFPIQITTASDTIIESKKETMEEYKIRIQKQLYKTTEKKYNNSIKENKKPFKMSVEGILFLSGVILILTSIIVGERLPRSANILFLLYTFLIGLLSLILSFVIFLFKKIKKQLN